MNTGNNNISENEELPNKLPPSKTTKVLNIDKGSQRQISSDESINDREDHKE